MDKSVKLIIRADGKQAESELKKLRGEMSSFAGGVVTAGAAIGAAGLAKMAYDLVAVNTEYQKLGASLTTVTGSSAAAAAEFEKLKQFASSTPFQVSEVVSAFIRLKALGLDPSIESLQSYGNTASAMGKTLEQVVEAVADASVGEFERLKEFGIKAKSEGDRVSLTFNGVTTQIGKNSEEITKYLKNIGDVKFGGAMELQMNTLGGAFSNLRDAYDNMLVSMGSNSGGNSLLVTSMQDLSKTLSDPKFIEGVDTLATALVALGNAAVWSIKQLGGLPTDVFNNIDETLGGIKKLGAGSNWTSEIPLINETGTGLMTSSHGGVMLPSHGGSAAPSGGNNNRTTATATNLTPPNDADFDPVQFELDQLWAAADMKDQIWLWEYDKKKAYRDQEAADLEAMREFDAQVNAQRYQAGMNFLSNLSTLQNSHSRKAFEVGKAAAISQTTIQTYHSATEAYAALAGIPVVGPALGAAAAAAAIAAGLMNVQAITATKFGGAGGSPGQYGTQGNPAVVTQPSAQVAATPAAPQVNVTILGNVVDQDAFARVLIPSIQKAFADGVA